VSGRALPSRLPLMQAPLGGSSDAALVAAVSGAGGLGTLGASWLPPGRMRDELAAIARAVDAPFAVNLVLDFEQEERLEVACEAGVAAVSFSWGVRPDLVARAHAAGCHVLVQVHDLASARAAAEAGADALIAQGVEAGGHVQGTVPLLDLVAAVRRELGLPLVAAGGIADAHGVAAALAAGAAAVACGTRFVAAAEASVEPYWAERIVAASASDAVLTGAFDVGWPDAPHRVLRNSTLAALAAAGDPPPGERPGEGEDVAWLGETAIPRYSDTPPVAGVRGDLEALALYAGTSAGAIREVLPAAEIVERLTAGSVSR
jgi:nitronate monooxygenase